MPTVVMERVFDEPVTDERLAEMKRATETCFQVNQVQLLQILAAADRKKFVCVFEAPDAASVRRAMDSVQMQYEAIWPAQRLT